MNCLWTDNIKYNFDLSKIHTDLINDAENIEIHLNETIYKAENIFKMKDFNKQTKRSSASRERFDNLSLKVEINNNDLKIWITMMKL